MAWTTPRTWVPGELVTASMMNTQIRDNMLALRAEHFEVQTFKGLQLRTHPDADLAPAQVSLVHADEIVLDDGTRIVDWDNVVANIAVAGAGGLDTGAEAASTWYEIFAIAKDDGTKNLLLHRAKDHFLDEEQTTRTGGTILRSGATTNVKLGQTFDTDEAGLIEFVDLSVAEGGTVVGNVWAAIYATSAGVPTGAALASSDKLDAGAVAGGTGQYVRFIFRSPISVVAGTTYALVLEGDYTPDVSNRITWGYNSAGGYAAGSLYTFDGTTWTVVSGEDFVFKVYVTRNDTAVTMPADYTKKARIGYVYNNSGNNFVPFVAQDRLVKPIVSGSLNTGTVAATVPTLVDLAAIVPPGTLVLEWAGGASGDGIWINISGMPDGFNGLSATLSRGSLAQLYYSASGGSVSNPTGGMGHVISEYQAIYAFSSAGSMRGHLLSWRWS